MPALGTKQLPDYQDTGTAQERVKVILPNKPTSRS